MFFLVLFQEIPGFLSNEECDHIITLAKDSGLRTSTSGWSTYDGDLDEELVIAGKVQLFKLSLLRAIQDPRLYSLLEITMKVI